MTINERIAKWNDERQLLNKEIDIKKEISFIIEECIEMVQDIKSEDAREKAEEIADLICRDMPEFDKERAVDACADINVFSTGLIAKMCYNPDIVMDEVLKEIESRTGEIVDGKFTKDKSPEAMSKWYKANFSKAYLKGE